MIYFLFFLKFLPVTYYSKFTIWRVTEYYRINLCYQIPSVNGESGSFNAAEEANRDVEPVAREMKGREAIKIVDLFKTFQACRKPEVKAVNGEYKSE